MEHLPNIVLVGNPNCGKSTLFNALTQAQARTGNWPGVTVDLKKSVLEYRKQKITVADLPGIYTLFAPNAALGQDERITREYLLNSPDDLIVNVVDASNLARQLYLTSQLLSLGRPMLVVLNYADCVQGLDVAALEAYLGCRVVLVSAKTQTGLTELKELLFLPHTLKKTPQILTAPLQAQWDRFACMLQGTETCSVTEMAWWLLEERDLPAGLPVKLSEPVRCLLAELPEDTDVLLAQSRHAWIAKGLGLIGKVQVRLPVGEWTSTLDYWVLHRIWGLPIFLLVMYCLFVFAIQIGGIFQPFFEQIGSAIFIDGVRVVLAHLGTPQWLEAVLAFGVGSGITTTLGFIPIIGALFFALSFLEDSGYMTRAIFVMDRLMRALGLPGKSFVPLLVGFGCNVPGVMAARTLEHERERILTILMSPFMTCGARLAIYSAFVSVFFPVHGAWVVFSLYFLGILLGLLTGILLKQTLLSGPIMPLLLELPAYAVPAASILLKHAYKRLMRFLIKAGKLIVPLCVLLGALGHVSVGSQHSEHIEDSVLAQFGRAMTPYFEPMGIHQDNWPATVGLVTGVMAKEVVIGTLNTLYEQKGEHALLPPQFDLQHTLKEAFLSIPAQLQGEESDEVGVSYIAKMAMTQHFEGKAGAFAYLLFVLLYFPCISVTATMSRETNWRWTAFSMFWNTALAYTVAVFFYQSVLLIQGRQTQTAIGWLLGIMAFWLFWVMVLRAKTQFPKLLPTPIVMRG